MAGIQLIGKEHVLEAFDDFEYDTWALFQGKQLLISGVGSDTLDVWLDRFKPAGSMGAYTLRIYDCDLPVKASTEYVAALNFKLQDDYNGMGIAGRSSNLMDRIGELEKKLDGDSDEGDDLMGVLMGWLKNPDKLETAIGAFMQLSGKQPENVPAGNMQPAAITGFKLQSDNAQDSEDKLERVAKALDKLEKRDPNIVEHLEKFAAMDAATFAFVMSKLDSL